MNIEFQTKIFRRVGDTGRFIQCGGMFARAISLDEMRAQLSNFLLPPFFKPADYLFVTREVPAPEKTPFIFEPGTWKP